MPPLLKALLLSISLFGLFVTAPAFAIEQGDVAPSFQLNGITQKVSLSDYKGKLVYVDFWASWCGPCKQSFPWMNTIANQYKAQGFEVLAINLDANKADAMKFLAQNPTQFSVAFDPSGATPKAYGVKGMPTSFLIGRDGKILYQHIGFNHVASQTIEKMVQQAITREAVN